MFIFTRELGLIPAHVQGVRAGHSKLRFGLQDFSHSNISLVHGKSGWKVVNAIPQSSWFDEFKNNSSKLYVCANTVLFLRKFVKGEEKDENLFNILKEGFVFLAKEKMLYQAIVAFQCLMMFRIFRQLGYIGEDQSLDYLFNEKGWSLEILDFVIKNQKKLLFLINKALKESHL